MSGFFSSKLALFVLAVIVFLHVGLTVHYLEQNRVKRQVELRDQVRQKIINAIYVVEATYESGRDHAISAMDDPLLKISLTRHPIYTMKFNSISYWDISRALRRKLDSFSLSIRMAPWQWLNLKATIYTQLLYQQLFLIAVELLVLGALFVSFYSIYRFTRPLKKFKWAAERLGVDLRSYPLDLYGPRVVRDAAHAMNQMQKRIQELIRNRTDMLAAISHDLRTPITRLKLRAHFISDKTIQKNILMDLGEMQSMISETLAFVRDDAIEEAKRPLDLCSLLASLCDDAVDLGHQLSFTSHSNRLPLMGRPLALKRAFDNLIGNSIRYAHEVCIIVLEHSKGIVVKIIDDGPGIPEDEIERVFEPFYRTEASRSRESGGVGLGLAVARDILQDHQGSISLANRKPHGLQVLVRFVKRKGVGEEEYV